MAQKPAKTTNTIKSQNSNCDRWRQIGPPRGHRRRRGARHCPPRCPGGAARTALGHRRQRRGARGVGQGAVGGRKGRTQGGGEVSGEEGGGNVTHNKILKYSEETKIRKKPQNQGSTCMILSHCYAKPTLIPRSIRIFWYKRFAENKDT